MTSINLLYLHTKNVGYGRMGSCIAEQLEAQGIEVFDHLPMPTETPSVLDHVNTGRHAGIANVFVLMSVPGHAAGWYKGQVPTLFSMWEGMRLPEAFHEGFHRFETIVAPSMQNVELFSEYHDNVHYAPLGVDPEVWGYQPRQAPKRFFRYLTGGNGARKGTDLTIKAFKRVWGQEGSWGDGPIPTLTLKSPKAPNFDGTRTRIEIVSGKITDQEEVDLYAGAHCYLQPARGEGFGLQPLQALAQGCPTILTGAHGHAAFADLGIPLSWTPSQSDYFIYGDAGMWWEPDFEELCEAMRDVYDNYDRHEIRARVNSAEALKLSWENTTNLMLDAIGRENLGPYTGPEEWFAVDQKLYKVVTTKDWYCEIADRPRYFLRGVEYWEFADIKRIMFEAGLLDPRCIDGTASDSGLTQEQVEKAGKYRAQHSDCPTCHRPLEVA